MDILLVTSSFNDDIHGSDDKKKTGCGISLIKPENISRYRISSVMTDLKEITCEKCKERLAKKIIRSDKKEMTKILKEERAKAKKGIEDEGIVPLGNTTAKITKSPEQKRRDEELAAETARKEAEAKRKAEEAAREAEAAAKKAAEEEALRASLKTIPGTGVAIDDSLAQFAINVPKEEETKQQPAEDDFLAQFAIRKPVEEEPAIEEEPAVEEIAEEPEAAPAVQDDFLAQFAIPTPTDDLSQPEYLSDDSYNYEDSSDSYETDDSVINVSEDELTTVTEEPAAEASATITASSDWEYVANQIFGFEGVDAPEPEPQPAEMEELPLPAQSAAPETVKTPEPKPAVPALEDIAPPALDDIKPPVLEDIAPPALDGISAPVLEEMSAPVLDEMTILEVPVLSSISSVPEQPAAEETAPADDFADFEIPEVPVLNSISAIAEEAEEASEEQYTEEITEEAEEEAEEYIEEAVEEAAEAIEEAEEEIVEESLDATEEIVEEIAEAVEEPVQTAPPVQAAPMQTVPPVQTAPMQTVPPVQTAPMQTIPPVQTAPMQTVPPVQTAPMQTVPPVQTTPMQTVSPVQTAPTQTIPPVQPQIITVPQLAGYDQNGQPVYTYVQMQMTGYDQNGQPVYNPVGGQQMPIPPQAPQRRPMMGMSNTMGGQMGANIQKPFVQLDAPTQTPAYIKAKLGDPGADGKYVQPSANISKIAVNPHSKETSKAFVNAISSSKDYANKNLIETQGLKANTPVLSSVEDVLSQMGDNSLKNKKVAEQAEVKLGSEYKASSARPSTPRPAPKKQEDDIRYMTKSELKDKKKQDKYAAKFKKDLAKRGF